MGATVAADVDEAISWREQGHGDVVLFLHGLGGSRTAWEPQLEDLSDGWRCVAWDMPGYGASAPVDPLTFPAIADAVAGLLDRLGVTSAHLCGLSFGYPDTEARINAARMDREPLDVVASFTA